METDHTEQGSLGEVVHQPGSVPDIQEWRPPKGRAYKVIAWIIIAGVGICLAIMLAMMVWHWIG
ncbi:MAG: hypothetical protein WD042_16125 [Phycisphaeraceae bacterium]